MNGKDTQLKTLLKKLTKQNPKNFLGKDVSSPLAIATLFSHRTRQTEPSEK
ncbi:hypothetical protein [Vibrio chaetopteri]|jgi:hypothetical protein|uniref:hypothetical protein n=1 Tax=Vibrio chaetopteri TaxID=3016528 RepID=UPI00345E8701